MENTKQELGEHIEDVVKALDGKVEAETIGKELETFINVYRVSLETAKRSIVRKYGGKAQDLAVGSQKTLSDLKGNEPHIDVIARVVSINKKEVKTDNGNKEIIYGLLGDGAVVLSFTMWDIPQESYAKGDVIRIENAYTKEWQGNPQVIINNRTNITKVDPSTLPKPAMTYTHRKIADVRNGMFGIVLNVRVLSAGQKEVKVEGNPKTIITGTLADDTGSISFSSWGAFPFKENDVVQIRGASARPFRGIPQLNIGESAEMEAGESASVPSREELEKQTTTIEHVQEIGGGSDVSVSGILIDVKTGSGLIFRCPECNRVVQKGVCRLHAKVEGKADLRIKGVLDDGTGAITVILNRELTEALSGKTLDWAIERAKQSMDPEVVADEVASLVIARPLRIKGNVMSDDYGLMMIAQSAEAPKINVMEQAQEMLRDMGVN